MPSRRVTQKHSDRVREQLEERIVDGTYPPATRLDEVALAKEFGVSRTPIRETLIQLAASGMIELRPRRGAIVSMMSPHRLSEMFEVMAELEAMAGRLAARRITEQERKSLLELHRRCEQNRNSDSTTDYFHLNEQFHQMLYVASGNEYLAEQATLLQRRLRPYRRLQLRIRNRLKQSFSEHERIVEAVVSGDEERAESELRNHVMIQGDRYRDLIASLHTLHPATGALPLRRLPPRRRRSVSGKKH